MKQTNHARLMLILSMAVFGTLAPFVRHIPLTSGELALGRAILAAGLIALCKNHRTLFYPAFDIIKNQSIMCIRCR